MASKMNSNNRNDVLAGVAENSYLETQKALVSIFDWNFQSASTDIQCKVW